MLSQQDLGRFEPSLVDIWMLQRATVARSENSYLSRGLRTWILRSFPYPWHAESLHWSCGFVLSLKLERLNHFSSFSTHRRQEKNEFQARHLVLRQPLSCHRFNSGTPIVHRLNCIKYLGLLRKGSWHFFHIFVHDKNTKFHRKKSLC